ncbi:MAG: hypothetical protein UT48_C0027G0009, partial [Parcubacteria group bacterium GW2011_GWE2_39_37]
MVINAVVAESVYATDLKSVEGNFVRVRVPPTAQGKKSSFTGLFCLCCRESENP